MRELQTSEIRSEIISHRKSGTSGELFQQILIKNESGDGYVVIFQIVEKKDGVKATTKNAVVLSKVSRNDRESGPRVFKKIETALSEIKKTQFKGPVVFNIP